MKLRENRLMLIWLFWVGLMIFGCGVAYFQGWWGMINAGDPTKLSFFIVGVFVIGLMLNARNAFVVNRELKNAMEVNNFCGESYLNKEIFNVIWKKSNTSLIGAHIMNLNKIAAQQKSGDIDQSPLIEAMAAELEAPESWTRYIATILASLGFVGTLVGFLKSMQGLDTLMSVDKENAIQGLQRAVHGMGTAFYTTLVGVVFGALFLELLHRLIGNAITRLVITTTKISEVYIIPHLKSKFRDEKDLLGESGENQK